MSADDLEQPGWDRLTGAGRLNAAKALAADSDHSLETRVTRTTIGSRAGQPALVVDGTVSGTHFRRRWL